ncbi:MAG: hypothetical protein EBV03_08325 [Proteobacteria bacterium]|nr:hypothetical protein [Pseudomonadota bacterium]
MPKEIDIDAYPENTPGDFVKNAYDKRVSSGMRGIWERIRETGGSGFGKGALIMAALAVAVVGLFGGYLGSGSQLEVSGSLITTFENGMGHGLSKGLEFLFSGVGAALVAAGGLIGMGAQVMHDQHKQAALETERLAIEYQRMREQMKEKGKEKPAEKTVAQHTEKTHEHHTEHHHHEHQHVARHRQPTAKPKESIYVPGTIVQEKTYMSAELKRRSERETTTTTVSV